MLTTSSHGGSSKGSAALLWWQDTGNGLKLYLSTLRLDRRKILTERAIMHKKLPRERGMAPANVHEVFGQCSVDTWVSF